MCEVEEIARGSPQDFHAAKGDESSWLLFAAECLAFRLQWQLVEVSMCCAATPLCKACSGHSPKAFAAACHFVKFLWLLPS